LYVILAMSAMSVPVGPHGSLLVAANSQRIQAHAQGNTAESSIPLRTLTCTEEYPLVTFLTERMTDDMTVA